MSDPTNHNTPAGWYDDGNGAQRYWDGAQWTEHTAPGTSATITGLAPQSTLAPAAAASKPHVLSIIALITAAVGFLFACIPGALIVGWILLPIAFVLSIVALFLNGKKWPAITALIASIVGTVVGFIVFFAVVATSFSDAFGGTDVTITEPSAATDESETVTEEEPSEGAAAPEAGTRENPVPLGTVISGDEYDVVINSVTLNGTDAVLAANMFNEAPPEGFVYAIINTTITYTGADSGFAAMVGLDFVTATGEVLTPSDHTAVAPEPALGFDELYTGGVSTGNEVIAIPADGNGLIRVTPGMFGDDVFVAVQ
ncbi:DUF2510 domain-containing protein [Agromyces aerolatus]|uniref:DUF2510 domain-containing protein n=1 Tax=Agromyces sp. LY-1074 TaxID=3074080 RepID=UPI00285D5F67|nr:MULTISPECIES: DUF2510 domain-containing protein [unclassified Agromyces]MDR5698498.1 DUF2510 domain-containing protein [Agromyces sp. LY-1074]MDR5704792.1 DUF2510 domain-containing protein [Agromyces sp. LY-1358]